MRISSALFLSINSPGITRSKLVFETGVVIKIDRRKDDKTSVTQWSVQLANSIYLPGASEFGEELVYRKSDRGKAITNRPFNAVASGTRLSENAIIEIEGISSRCG
ncbi:unnamed protein product [Lasius platythorax]|uniref:Uncharacterized protein n=1 Tax=Lasius platythorax TaxID=488582 RepID=A0AAV2NMT7_9HYME